jgi:hypothetical protein
MREKLRKLIEKWYLVVDLGGKDCPICGHDHASGDLSRNRSTEKFIDEVLEIIKQEKEEKPAK